MISYLMDRTHDYRKTSSQAGALWRCPHCGAWWGSQIGKEPGTNFLLCLPEAIANTLSWDDYRGWKSAHVDASVCPRCGKNAVSPVFARQQ